MLAYYDTFSGLVPCKVVATYPEIATLRLTATRGAYKRGEVISVPRHHVWSRKSFPCRGTYGQRWIVFPIDDLAVNEKV